MTDVMDNSKETKLLNSEKDSVIGFSRLPRYTPEQFNEFLNNEKKESVTNELPKETKLHAPIVAPA